MDDLLQFLRARLDEDEQAARAATWDEWDSAHWTAHHRAQYDGRWVIVDHAEEGVTELTPHAADDAGVAQHIARHDPARVLREVEAKRRRLTRHVPERRRLTLLDVNGSATSFGFYVCTSCTPNRTIEHGQEVVEWPCPDVLDDALPYADHPDYRPDWRP
ncbi:DUF6221 family protein [Streptomyces sp. NBC_01237]|uniref:DUF6221 family protein n=1 Tax=Streptomyces sp. NBC_01237 TaxID=2903790 RepID=UPI002DD8709A|nr:DUF6221 family protein [Streptomyces sp. NBC_01237]WRZ72876.1 DUF6221 family protein [Streptomyces sp. NBC_01237]